MQFLKKYLDLGDLILHDANGHGDPGNSGLSSQKAARNHYVFPGSLYSHKSRYQTTSLDWNVPHEISEDKRHVEQNISLPLASGS